MNMFDEESTDLQYTTLYTDIENNRDTLYSISLEIRDNAVSKYPIFVAFHDPVNLGKPFLKRTVNDTNWNINISILEDLVNKKVIELEKLQAFTKIYKDPEYYFCFLVIGLRKSEFIFVERSRNTEESETA